MEPKEPVQPSATSLVCEPVLSPAKIGPSVPAENPRKASETAEEQIKRQFVIFDSPHASSTAGPAVNTGEIYDSWKTHKEQYAVMKEWEMHRHRCLLETKELLDTVCESLFTALTTAVSNNKNMAGYFTAISNSLKDFSKQMSKVPDLLQPLAELHSKAGNGSLTKLFNNAATADSSFSKSAAELAKYVDSVILSDLKSAISAYNKNVSAQKEVCPKLAKAVEETEGKIMSLFHAYTAAVNSKEMQILSGQPESDLWPVFHQYSVAVKRQADNIMKYTTFCQNLIEDRQNLETMRIDSCNKSLEKYFQQHKIAFGHNEIFAAFLPSVLHLLFLPPLLSALKKLRNHQKIDL